MSAKGILLGMLLLNGSALGVSPGIVISQLYGGGGNSGAALRNDFIELFNRGSVAVNVTGWSVQYSSAAGGSWEATRLAGSIPPGGYFLVQQAQGAGGTVNLPPADVVGILALGASSGKVALVGNDTPLSGACPAATEIVDLVGYGTANCSEGSPAATLTNTTALFRAAGGCADSDNNSADFTAAGPAPRNSATPAAACGSPSSSTSSSTIAGTTSTSSTTTTGVTTSTTLPALQLVFPHIADGGGYRTTLLLTNASETAAGAQAAFFAPDGRPLSLRIGAVTASTFQLSIPAGGVSQLATEGAAASVATGWARITAPAGAELNGNAVFQLFGESGLVSEASVPVAPVTRIADFYADESPGIHTGWAMANPGTTRARGSISLRGGGVTPTAVAFDLAPGGQQARFLFELFPGARSGRAEIRLTEGALAVVALRFHDSSLFSTLSTGVPGASWTTAGVLFSPRGGVRSRLVAELDRAAGTIDLAIYSFTSFPLRDALIRARNRGVAIRIVCDAGSLSDPNSQIPALENLGFSVKRLTGVPSGLMHDKYMIIDGTLLFTGSYNWSNSAEEYNFENALFLQGSPVIGSYSADFNRLWAK